MEEEDFLLCNIYYGGIETASRGSHAELDFEGCFVSRTPYNSRYFYYPRTRYNLCPISPGSFYDMALSSEALDMNKIAPPSQPQVALALAIVKQKPPNIDLKEHILQIRHFIKDARYSHRDTSPDKYFDSVSFWQQAYEKSEAEQSKLLDHIYELEQRNAALVAKLKTGSATTALEEENAQVSNKRKAVNRNTVSRKRTKVQTTARDDDFSIGSQMSRGSLLDGVESMEGSTASFMRRFYALQKLLQKRPNRGSVALAATDLCEIATREVLSAITQSQKKQPTSRSKQTTTAPQTRQPDFPSVLHGVERAVKLLYQALDKLSGTEDRRDAGHVTYHLVGLFDGIMVSLQQHCKAIAEQTITNVKGNAKSQKNKQAAKSKRAKTGLNAGGSSQGEDRVAVQITRLLGTMALSLKVCRPEHRQVLEGFLFVLLSRVGKLLCLFVFQDLRLRPDLQINTSKLPLPKGLVEPELNEAPIHGAQMEARYLVWLLDRILTFLDASPSTLLSPSSSNQEKTEKGGFVSKIKETLQSTLLQAVFGADDPLFQKHLQHPIPPDAMEMDRLRNYVQIPEQTVPDWFTQEVWRLLGWEMLMKVDDGKD